MDKMNEMSERVSYRIFLFLLPLLFCLSDQFFLNLLGDLVILALAEVPKGSCVHKYVERGLKYMNTLMTDEQLLMALGLRHSL